MATDVQIALQPQAGQDPAAALTAAAAKLVRASIETLIQQAGQPMTGKIIAPPPNLPSGLAQIAVADLILTLKLSAPLPTGTPVRVEVQQNPAGPPSVTVQQVAPPLPQTAAPTPAPRAPTPLPLPPAPQQMQSATPTAPFPQAPVTPAQPSPTPAPVTSQPAVQPQPAVPTAQAPMPAPHPAATTTPAPVQSAAAPVQGQLAAPVIPQTASAPAQVQAPGQPVAPPLTVATQPAPVQSAAAAPVQSAPVATTSVAAQPSVAPSPPSPVAAQPGAPPAAVLTQAPAPSPTAGPPAPAATTAPATTQAPQPQVQLPPAAQPQVAAPPQVLMQRLTQAFAPPPAAATPAPAPGSPAQLVMAAATQAAAQQQSPAPLLQALAVRLPHLPAPVAEAATKVLAGRVSLDRGAPTGEALKQAVLRSGVFLDSPAKVGAQPDLRQALTQLRSTLMAWLGDDIAPVAPVVRRPPPPTRGAMPRGQAPELPQAPEGSGKEAGKALLGQTEGALARVKLMQLSTHGADAARPASAAAAPTEWNLELPMMLGHELAMAHVQIGRDARGKTDPKEKHWRLRFALKFSVLGEVGAQVSMVGARTSIAIWADEEATAETLEAMLPELAPSLAAKGLDLVSLTVRRGVPRDESQPSGRLMDSTR